MKRQAKVRRKYECGSSRCLVQTKIISHEYRQSWRTVWTQTTMCQVTGANASPCWCARNRVVKRLVLPSDLDLKNGTAHAKLPCPRCVIVCKGRSSTLFIPFRSSFWRYSSSLAMTFVFKHFIVLHMKHSLPIESLVRVTSSLAQLSDLVRLQEEKEASFSPHRSFMAKLVSNRWEMRALWSLT